MPRTVYPISFRQKFIAALAEHDGPFRDLCARFGVSHETAYEWVRRVARRGVEGLEPTPSAPRTVPHATSLFASELVIQTRQKHPTWGPRKIRHVLHGAYPNATLPAPSTIGDILKRAGLVLARKRRRHITPSPLPFAPMVAPNRVWTADWKGQFRTADGRFCYPLTIADGASRYLLRCEACASPNEAAARQHFEAAFREYGLPDVLHTDNGTPFASTAPGGLSRLSAWWVRLGILPERSRPSRPADNGRHERMHRTLKAEATAPPQANQAAQQRVFNAFRREYNEVRPHEALGYKTPAQLYSPSVRPYPRRLPDLEYADDHDRRRVDPSGHIKWHGRPVFLTGALAGETVGITMTDDETSAVYFGPILLGMLSSRRPELGLVRLRAR